MRVAVVSDIHGNLTALEAVIADLKTVSPDLVIQAGDLPAMGGRPAEVVDRVRELGWPGVLGNTDEMLWRPELFEEQSARAPKIRDLLDLIFNKFAPATREMLGEERLRWLRELPTEWRQDNLAVVHASPGDLWRAPMPDCDAKELAETYAGLRAAVVAYGHIHRPYVRQVSGFVVASCGSVGSPYDGDPRASYLVIEDGKVTIRRVQYDVEAERKSLLASGYPHAAWIAEIRRQAKYVPLF